MATVADILSRKEGRVYSIAPRATVFTAAQAMNIWRVGCLLVMDQGRIMGIFTERDILRRVVAECLDPATTPVEEVMSREVICCRHDTPLDEARTVMMTRRIRHLPVVGVDERVCGLISIGDLNAQLVNDQEVTIQFLHEYLNGHASVAHSPEMPLQA
ncbi:MAG: CBS domain-containing protein [Planctomycetes bacterium]|nr:CBS domain-containing protein [Planctomycetota bacterium]